MSDSCCLCGLVLAPGETDFPEWYKDICACRFFYHQKVDIVLVLYIVCWFEGRPILSGRGYIDEDVNPLNVPFYLSMLSSTFVLVFRCHGWWHKHPDDVSQKVECWRSRAECP